MQILPGVIMECSEFPTYNNICESSNNDDWTCNKFQEQLDEWFKEKEYQYNVD